MVILAGVAGAGCQRTPEMTVTEAERRGVDPKVGQFLVEGQQAYERGSYTLALALTDSVERYAPRLADLHFLRGLVYTQLNQLEVAQAAYETVIEIDPAYRGARYNMGLNAFRRGRLRDAIDSFEQEKALEATSNLLLELGRAYAKLGEPDSARMAYEQALTLDSTNATALMWLGQLNEEVGELDEALVASQAGLKLRPDDPDYQYIVGSLLLRSGKVQEAATYLEPVAAQRPWHHGAQFNMGQVLMRLGRQAEAKAYFARADSAQQLQQQINEAQNDINQEPDKLEHWVNLGTLLRKTGQLEKAVDAFKVASSMDPWNMYLQSNTALLIMETGDTEDAIRRFEAILGVDPALPDVWLNLGVAYANAGRTEEARVAWLSVLKYRPNDLTAQSYLARLPEGTGTP